MEEKKISIFRSLTAKLFYYMAALTIIVIVGTSYQNQSGFSNFLAEHASSELVSRAEMAKAQIEAQLENWKGLTGSVVAGYSGDNKLYGDELARVVDANSDFIAIQVFKGTKDGKNLILLADSRTKKTNDVRFEDKTGAAVMTQSLAESLRLIPQKAKFLKANKTSAVHSLASKTKLPIMFMVSKHELPDSSEALWSTLIIWQTSLIKSLPKSSFIDSALIDGKGDIFSSNNLLLMTTKNKFSGEKITTAATSARKLSDVVEEYQSSKDKKVVGGYARAPMFGLAVVVEEDFDRAYAEMNSSRARTYLWALLFLLFAAMLSYVASRRTLKSIAEVQQAIRRVGKGNFEDGVVLNSNDEISLLARDLNSMGSDITKLMRDDTAEKMAEIDLATAKTMQTNFFPRKNILAKNLRVSGFYQPSSKCGGDLWGYYELQDDLHLLYVADAMGVGVQAALVTSMTYAVSATMSRLAAEKNAQLEKPSDVLRYINGIVWDAFQGSMSLTFFCAIIDTKNGKMTYANAGHNFPFIIPAQAKDSRNSTKPSPGAENKPLPFSIKQMGNPLGMQNVAIYTDKELTIEAGDKIFLFSDGLIECSSPQGEVWGRKHLFNQLSEITTLPFDELKDEVLSRAFSFFANKPLEDDVTVVVAEIPKAWKSQKTFEKVSRRPSVPLPIPEAIKTVPIPPPPPTIEVAHESMREAHTETVLEPSSEQSTKELASISVANEPSPAPAEAASASDIANMVESELEVLRIELGFNTDMIEDMTKPVESIIEVETPKELSMESPVTSESAQEIQQSENHREEAAAFEINFALDLDSGVQEITTSTASEELSYFTTPSDTAPVKKKVPKGKYKIRLPRTG